MPRANHSTTAARSNRSMIDTQLFQLFETNRQSFGDAESVPLLQWVFEATRAYAGSKFKVQGFKVLAPSVVARSMQLIAGRTAQE
jgi:hypothetical protein